MPKLVPSKNVDPVLVDVKRPDFNYRHVHSDNSLNLSKIPQAPAEESPVLGRVASGLGILAVALAVAFVAVNFVQAGTLAKTAGKKIVENFSNSVVALRDFKPDTANRLLEDNNGQIGVLDRFLKDRHGETLLGALGGIIPAFKETGTLVSSIASLNFNFLKLSTAISDLKTNGFHYFQNDGQKLIERLTDARNSIALVNSGIKEVKGATGELKKISSTFEEADRELGSQYVAHADELDRADAVLDEVITTFGSDTPRNVLIMFQNPAEIRPAGGFLGSYGVLTIRGGQMQALEVGDIYNPDRLFTAKVVPPEALQRTVTDWSARDANWFFDFPTSAKTVEDFLERSALYSKDGVKFDAVVAVNINVLETILGSVGSISLPEYKLVITQNNFLSELQREVEAGKDKKPGQNPKRILSVLAPQIFERLGKLNEVDRTKLMEKFGKHVAQKDIMVYAKTPRLSEFLKSSNFDGSVFEIPEGFFGSYLAVVNANIAGGKSDAFIDEKVKAVIDLDTDGGSASTVTVSRTHNGQNEKDAWWRTTNQDFMQVFVNPNSSLLSAKGNNARNSSSGFSYGSLYERNADLEAIEKSKIFSSTYQTITSVAHGKTVFGSWVTTPAGTTKEFSVRYQTPGMPTNPGVGMKYSFVFDRQSGVDNALDVSIGAPLGYRWAESNTSVFTKSFDHVDARTIIELTLTR